MSNFKDFVFPAEWQNLIGPLAFDNIFVNNSSNYIPRIRKLIFLYSAKAWLFKNVQNHILWCYRGREMSRTKVDIFFETSCMKVCKCASMHIFTSKGPGSRLSMQVCMYVRFAHICKYASMQVCKYVHMQVCTYMQVCKYASLWYTNKS